MADESHFRQRVGCESKSACKEKVRRDPIISSLQMNTGHIREHEQRDGVREFHLILLRVAEPVDVFQRVGLLSGNERAGETSRTCTTLHQEHRQNSCGVFGYTLAGSDA
ncbi:hypothetical protein PENNAL_c0136G04893 [Penicillium nalgiovense]|uniref:Uncharacterized protein n=1 Tax=Penicillium nalgiovense TaxID=60175 RepID=A0A1V6X2L6_PENNA|nr:hypothetical protein PENNAL_c0136G04893 [Penicillium nalgiovense]